VVIRRYVYRKENVRIDRLPFPYSGMRSGSVDLESIFGIRPYVQGRPRAFSAERCATLKLCPNTVYNICFNIIVQGNNHRVIRQKRSPIEVPPLCVALCSICTYGGSLLRSFCVLFCVSSSVFTPRLRFVALHSTDGRPQLGGTSQCVILGIKALRLFLVRCRVQCLGTFYSKISISDVSCADG
jgi:hypothetical protein